ncbi:MAG TPA: hypothetical protein ENN75_03870, partial [candidate division Zixibacteria bacterium]|nr:hypothetical protein [candidate division Zixibacteria bacterium]
MTIRASIDVGTNSILLLVAEVHGDRLIPIHQDLAEPRLGRGIEKNCVIAESAIIQALYVVKDFARKARELGAVETVIFGTEVFRRASNGQACISRIERAVNIPFRILSQGEEAKYAFRGALSGTAISGNAVVMDVGGGSTEIVFGKNEPENWISRPIGAVVAAEKYSAVPPFGEGYAGNILAKITEEFRLPFDISPSESSLIGVGGTITTLGAISAGLREYDDEKVAGKKLTVEWMRQTFQIFAKKEPR